ncbi:response regulator transcription factor [Paenibacillus lemnae]|uniref:Response regulator transcription factor n=1 Tax=Paenibacillus lemnae TaxID=1330551 RepID=A0A848MAD6_PAELE|nr:response regulator transcription factor [Paenibacillus lemnae]NMO97219.1 response regulator transcription factor [Paenibacillus lemnae]
MIEVLIVDDEPKLREGLKSIVPWSEIGYHIADTAANGMEALEKHKQIHPGLMVVDIRMPGMDGIQLIEAIRETDPDVHLLILSGYADFDYAKRAISQGVDGYLLKPVDEEELENYLYQIRDKILQEQTSDAIQMTSSGGERERFIQKLVSAGTADASGLERAGQLNLLWDQYQVILLYIHGIEGTEAEGDAALKQMLYEKYEQNGEGIVFSTRSCLGILQPVPVSGEPSRKELLTHLQEAVQQCGLTAVFAIGAPVRALKELPAAYRSARELISARFFYEDQLLLYPDSVRFGSEHTGYSDLAYSSGAVTDQLYYAIDAGQMETLSALVNAAAETMMQEQYTEEKMKGAFVELLTAVYGKLTRHRAELQSRTSEKEYSDHIAAVYRQPNVYALCRHSISFLEMLAGQDVRDSRGQEMKKILDLIDRNYNENLKLESLAAVFNYNSAYLGKMFKNTTGEYFNTYLDKVRMEKAKELLKQGMKVYHVAEQVGYSNVDYFHSKFKKYVGTSPSNYRKEPEE